MMKGENWLSGWMVIREDERMVRLRNEWIGVCYWDGGEGRLMAEEILMVGKCC